MLMETISITAAALNALKVFVAPMYVAGRPDVNPSNFLVEVSSDYVDVLEDIQSEKGLTFSEAIIWLAFAEFTCGQVYH